MNVLDLSAKTIANKIKTQELTAELVMETFLDRIQSVDERINAFITLNDRARDEAKALDQKIKAGQSVGPLAGVPLAVKDMFCTRGLRTTAASKILENFVPPYTSTCLERLQQAGAIVIGKANQDEFAMGSSNETSYFGPCKNPWDLERVPGGSSGGSAAAVAASMAPAALGTDTGGSVRQPASFCGIVGLKPTYGRISRYGIIAFASSLDQAGPMTKTVTDAALLAEVMSGADPMDATTSEASVPAWSTSINTDLSSRTLGVPKQYFSEGLEDSVRAVIEHSIEVLKQKGAKIVEVDLNLIEYSVPTYYLVSTSEASSNLARYDGIRFGRRADFTSTPPSNLGDFYSQTRSEGFGEETQRRILLGTHSLSSGYYDLYYKKASQVRRLIQQEFQNAFDNCDALIAPVTTTTAFKIGDRVKHPLKSYLNDIYTASSNLSGIPSISVPAGFDDSGLPVGVQILAAHFNEQVLFDVGAAVEASTKAYERLSDVLR